MSTKALDDLRALSVAVDREEYLQHRSNWQSENWILDSPIIYKGRGHHGIARGKELKRLCEFSDFIYQQPNPISRRDVLTHLQGADGNSKSLERGFLLTMMWGFGPNPLGPYRTSVMLESGGDNLGNKLSNIFAVLNKKLPSEEDIRAAYVNLLRLEQCGPAYATKFMYFASPESARIPIFDSQVVAWLESEGRTGATKQKGSLSALNKHHFFDYYRFCKTASEELGITDLGLLEYLMFIDQNAARLVRGTESLPKWIKRTRFSGAFQSP